MKVMFVQPRYFNIWEALSIAYIAAYTKEKYPGKLQMSFYQGYFDDDETIINDAKNSDIVAFSCTSPVYRAAVQLAGKIKKINSPVRTVFGGWHPSAVPYDCIGEDVVDQVVVGEGEEAFLDIMNGDMSPVIYGRKLSDLNEIFPDRDLIKNMRTVDLCEKMIGERITSFQSVRGCPFSCAFCSERVVTGVYNRKVNPLRERDHRHLLEEIAWIAKKYSLSYFKFVDATWNTSTDKVISFCEEKMRMKVSLPWEANVHAAFVNKEMLKAMKAAGCRQINVGCESGSQKVLKEIRKGLSVEKIRDVFKWSKKIGLERRAFFLLGMPSETVEDIRLTEKLIEEIQPDVFGITILSPYPGSDLYDETKMRDYDWTCADEYSNPYWHTEHFQNTDLKEWQEYLTNKFESNLAWHHKILKE